MRSAFVMILAACAVCAAEAPRFRWETFTTANGLPDDHVFTVRVDGSRVWAGTENGLALYEEGKWTVFTPKDGLAHRAVLYVAPDPRTGDVWIATMGGLSRFSAGRFENFTQLSSGLPNDVVYGVAVQGDSVWTATAAGAGRLNTRTGEWRLFNDRNTPMYEIWTYSVDAGIERTYYAVWGGGVLEYDEKSGRWTEYTDPDAETEIVLHKDQGLIHEITSSVSWAEKDHVLWVATYFGASRYDGRKWTNYLDKDSGLPSNFINQVKAMDGRRAWFATDKGLAYFDGETWAVYRPAPGTQRPEMYVRDAAGKEMRIETATAPAHQYVLGIDFQGDDVWVATAKGLSRGVRVR